jgi:hypothetical protein
MRATNDDRSKLRRYVARRVRELRERGATFDAIAADLGVSKPQVYALATKATGGLGPESERAFARAWFGGSLDALQRAADAWCKAHPDDDASARAPAVEVHPVIARVADRLGYSARIVALASERWTRAGGESAISDDVAARLLAGERGLDDAATMAAEAARSATSRRRS